MRTVNGRCGSTFPILQPSNNQFVFLRSLSLSNIIGLHSNVVSMKDDSVSFVIFTSLATKMTVVRSSVSFTVYSDSTFLFLTVQVFNNNIETGY